MRHLPHRQGVLVAALLAALLGGSAGLADEATAAPKDKDTPASKAKHGPKHAPSARHDERAAVPPTPHKQQRRATSPRPTAVALLVPPTAVPTAVTVGPPAAVLRPEAPAGSPFRRTSRPVRPLVRPSVVPRSTVLWRVHEPADRPLLHALRTGAQHSRTPLLIAALVGLFLLVQHRIDRDDPKLSRGHRSDPPDLRFRPAMAL